MSPLLDAAPLGRAATVVRNGRDVLDRGDLETGRLQRADGRLTSGARALDPDLDALHAEIDRFAGAGLGRDLRRERGALARALEAHLARAGPGDDGAVHVGDRDDGVVEAGLHVGDSIRTHAPIALLDLLHFSHSKPPLRSRHRAAAARSAACLASNYFFGPAFA